MIYALQICPEEERVGVWPASDPGFVNRVTLDKVEAESWREAKELLTAQLPVTSGTTWEAKQG